MDAVGLHLNIDYVGGSGSILTPEQKAALQTSLVILQSESKFHRVYFWGKIYGARYNYYIAQGVYQDEFRGRTAFYSQDCVQWRLLPTATLTMRLKSHIAKGRFTGDPSYQYEHVSTKKTSEGDSSTEENETITILEEERVASVVADIDEETWIVPRGAFVKTPTDQVFSNTCFKGLSVSEAARLCSYFHFRQPALLLHKTLLKRSHLDPAIDFMDAIDEDVPRGTWCMQFERGSGLVVLRNLLWPGYVFYHVPGTPSYGSVYFGNADRNWDLPFML